MCFNIRIFLPVFSSQVLQLWGVCGRCSAGLQQLWAVQRGHIGSGNGRTLHEALLWEPLGRVLLTQGQIEAYNAPSDGRTVDCWCFHRPSHTLHLLRRLSGGSSSSVYSLMYRYICIDLAICLLLFPQLAWSFRGPQLNCLELVLIPHHREWQHVSLHLLSSLFIFTSAPHLLFAFSCHVLSQAPCCSKAFGQWWHGLRPWVFWLSDLYRRSGTDHTNAV